MQTLTNSFDKEFHQLILKLRILSSKTLRLRQYLYRQWLMHNACTTAQEISSKIARSPEPVPSSAHKVSPWMGSSVAHVRKTLAYFVDGTGNY